MAKKEVYKVKPMTEGKRNIIAGLLQEYDIQSAEDIQEALKDLLGGTIQEMLESEMNEHLGYEKYEHSPESNYRNGKKLRKLEENMVKWILKFHRIGIVHLSLKLCQNEKKTFQLLKIR